MLIDAVYIYRTAVGNSGVADFYYVDEVPFGTTTYPDNIPTTDIVANDTLQSAGWAPPPEDMHGLVLMPNGFAMGFTGNTVVFSEPYRLHAWPVEYALATEYPIVGLGVHGQSCAIMTQAFPYVATGTRPDSVALIKIRTPEPCLSKKSIVPMLHGVVYASQNGLVMMHSGGADLVTKGMISKEEWQVRYKPELIDATRYLTKYLATNGAGSGFIINLDFQDPDIVDLTGSLVLDNIYNDDLTGEVFAMEGNILYLWDTPTEPRTSYRWRSKEYHLPAPVNLGAFILHARDHGYNGGTPSPTPPPQTITLRVWAQDTAGDMVLLFDH
jgi:hypothetical protein